MILELHSEYEYGTHIINGNYLRYCSMGLCKFAGNVQDVTT